MNRRGEILRHVVVTGAAHGIGRETALAFSDAGTLLTLVDMNGPELERVAGEIEGRGARVGGVIALDLAVGDAAERVLEGAWESSPVDVVVSSAGIYPSADVMELEAEHWDRVQAVNVRAPVLLTAAFARRAVNAGRPGCVVNISSGAALRARPGGSAYSTSKAALEAATRAAALELAPHRIRVNAVAPGFIPVHSEVNPVTDDYARAASENPLGRAGTPRDVAEAVLWLAGAESSWVTGQIIRVDGGVSTGAWSLPHAWPSAR